MVGADWVVGVGAGWGVDWVAGSGVDWVAGVGVVVDWGMDCFFVFFSRSFLFTKETILMKAAGPIHSGEVYEENDDDDDDYDMTSVVGIVYDDDDDDEDDDDEDDDEDDGTRVHMPSLNGTFLSQHAAPMHVFVAACRFPLRLLIASWVASVLFPSFKSGLA